MGGGVGPTHPPSLDPFKRSPAPDTMGGKRSIPPPPLPQDRGPDSTPKAFPYPNTSPQPHFQPPVTAPQPLAQSPVTALPLLRLCPRSPPAFHANPWAHDRNESSGAGPDALAVCGRRFARRRRMAPNRRLWAFGRGLRGWPPPGGRCTTGDRDRCGDGRAFCWERCALHCARERGRPPPRPPTGVRGRPATSVGVDFGPAAARAVRLHDCGPTHAPECRCTWEGFGPLRPSPTAYLGHFGGSPSYLGLCVGVRARARPASALGRAAGVGPAACLSPLALPRSRDPVGRIVYCSPPQCQPPPPPARPPPPSLSPAPPF